MYFEFYESVFDQGNNIVATAAFANVNRRLLHAAKRLEYPAYDPETHEFTVLHPWRMRVELVRRQPGTGQFIGQPFYILDVGHDMRTETVEEFKALEPPILMVDYEVNASVTEPLVTHRYNTDDETNRPVLQARLNGHIEQHVGTLCVCIAGKRYTEYRPTANRALACIATATAKALEKSFPTHDITVDESKLKTF